MLGTAPTPTRVCHRCDWHGPLVGGVMTCAISGRDIREHAAAYDCPRARYPLRGLGDLVARVLVWIRVGPAARRAIEAATGKPCGCKERQSKLNRLLPAR